MIFQMDDENFLQELYWCIDQIELGLESQKTSSKQGKMHQTLHELENFFFNMIIITCLQLESLFKTKSYILMKGTF